jgi:hypothetical protein
VPQQVVAQMEAKVVIVVAGQEAGDGGGGGGGGGTREGGAVRAWRRCYLHNAGVSTDRDPRYAALSNRAWHELPGHNVALHMISLAILHPVGQDISSKVLPCGSKGMQLAVSAIC